MNNVQEFVLVVFAILIVFASGIALEAVRYKGEMDIGRLTTYLLNDFSAILKAVIKFMVGVLANIFRIIPPLYRKIKTWLQPEQRVYLEEVLEAKLNGTIKSYSNTTFDITLQRQVDNDVIHPAVHIRCEYVGKQGLTEEERLEVTQLALKQFRDYLTVRRYNWKTFATNITIDSTEIIKLYYCELESDKEHFKYRYDICVKEQSIIGDELLQDDGLNEELKRVD